MHTVAPLHHGAGNRHGAGRLPEGSWALDFTERRGGPCGYGRISLIRPSLLKLRIPRAANAAISTVTAFQMAHGPWPHAAGAEIRNPSMLPGLSAFLPCRRSCCQPPSWCFGPRRRRACLRATHEQYVSNPSWPENGPQEQVVCAGRPEPAPPVARGTPRRAGGKRRPPRPVAGATRFRPSPLPASEPETGRRGDD